MKRDNELGSVERGKLADIIIIDGNPVSKMSDIRKVETVIKDGVIYKSADIFRSVGVKK